jgi:GNAT superfamily N-acetyltransferase
MPLHAPLELPSYERWMDEDAAGPDVLEGGTLVALDGECVVGFVSLLRRAADPHLAENGLTSVAASHRNRGIATALKQAQIAWASRNGFRELMTSTQDANAADAGRQRQARLRAAAGLDPPRGPLDEVEAALAADAELRR